METKEIKINVPEGYEIDTKKSTFQKIIFKKKDGKDLLLKDICARLSYGVKATTTSNGWNGIYAITGCIGDRIYLDCPIYEDGDDEWLAEMVKPYLRPLSSMTEEEKHNILRAWNIKASFVGSRCDAIVSDNTWWGGKDKSEPLGFDSIPFKYMSAVIEWLNEHHFDYRGLIEKGLALEAPEGMYNKQ